MGQELVADLRQLGSKALDALAPRLFGQLCQIIDLNFHILVGIFAREQQDLRRGQDLLDDGPGIGDQSGAERTAVHDDERQRVEQHVDDVACNKNIGHRQQDRDEAYYRHFIHFFHG